MEMLKDDCTARDGVRLTESTADLISSATDVTMAITLSLRKVKTDPRYWWKAKVMQRGAIKISIGFGVASSIAGTIGSLMDIYTSILKRDKNAAIGHTITGVIGALSIAASLPLLLHSLKIRIIKEMVLKRLIICNFWLGVALVIGTIIVALLSDDDFQTFLKSTVFTSTKEIRRINERTPNEVKIELCLHRRAYTTPYREKLYKVDYVYEGDVKKGNKDLDLCDFDNMLGWIYNLVVGFSVDGTKFGPNITISKKFEIPTTIIHNFIVGCYIEGVSQIDSKIMLYPSGVKAFLKNIDHKSEDVRINYRPLTEKLENKKYETIKNIFNKVIGEGYRYELNIEQRYDFMKNQKIPVNLLMRYIIFFRMNIDGNLYWPYMRETDNEPIYVAITDTVSGTPGYGEGPGGKYPLTSAYAIPGAGISRHDISHTQAILLGTESGILHYIGDVETKLLNNNKKLGKPHKL